MRTRHTKRTAAAVLAASLTAIAAGCGDSDEERAALALSDTTVLKEMRSPETPGRIIYDPPTDLSYASARLRRPDLVRADTARRRDTSTTRR